MDNEIEERKKPELKYTVFMWACLILYITTMVGKVIFTAELDVILEVFNTDNSTATLSNVFYYTTYAITQIILAFVFQKLNIRKTLLFTLPFSAISYIVLAFAKDIKTFWVIFALNGIFQAGAYSGCVYLLTTFLPESMHQKAKKLTLAGFAIGSTFAYLLVIFTVAVSPSGKPMWQLPFLFTGIVFIVFLILFALFAFKLKPIKAEKEQDISVEELPPLRLKAKKSAFWYYVISILFALITYAMYYGISGLFATSIKNIFGISQSYAIYISIAIPILTYLGPVIGVFYSEKQPNFLKCCMVLSVAIIMLLTGICVFYNILIGSFVLSVIMIFLTLAFILLARAMTSFTVTVAFKMRNEVNSGVYSAITNAIASVSAGVTPYVISLIVANSTNGWRSQYVFSLILCLVITPIIAVAYIITRKNFKENKNA